MRLPTRESPEGEFNLVNARVDSFHDEKATWPQLLSLDGLTYGDLTYMPARERLDWLNRSAGYSPQPMSSSPDTTGGWGMTTRPAACC